MTRFISILILSLLFNLNFVNAQNDDVIFTLDGENVYLSEFESIYNKNNFNDSAVISIEDLEKHLDLFVNFKLKVKEAEFQKLDTNPKFITELAGYRKQLTQPYLTDKSVTEELLKEAYERMLYDVKASHILVRVDPEDKPEDTLAAYNKIMESRKKILSGEDFGKVALKYSEDKSVVNNKGELKYFTAFQMVYPFETAAYNTKPGEISMPIRTRFGYHLVKTIDKRKALGKLKTAHIMIKNRQEKSEAIDKELKDKIDTIYAKLQRGEDFGVLASKYSEDKPSAKKGGELPEFKTGEFVSEFEVEAYNLKNDGDYSKPFQTSYGWHIVKRISKTEIEKFEDIKGSLKQKIERDSRSNKPKESFIAKIKKEYNFTENPQAKEEFYSVVDESIFSRQWDIAKAEKLNKTIFTLNSIDYSQKDFSKYILDNQPRSKQSSIEYVIDNLYSDFVEKTIMDYENSRLEDKYPKFKALMKEYRDGILLFELTDKKVWSKALRDTSGLEEFYEKNKNNYMQDKSLDAVIYKSNSSKHAKKVRKLLFKCKHDSIILNTLNTDSTINISVIDDKKPYFKENNNEVINAIEWKTGVSKIISSENSYYVVKVLKVIDAKPKELKDTRGMVIADYQNYLESKWILELKEKYPIKKNNDILEKLIK